MRSAAEWNARYTAGDLPWDTGRHDANLEQTIRAFDIKPCAALELGCGTGANAVWLANMRFRVTAADISAHAVEQARQRAARAGAAVEFHVADVFADGLPGGPFDFVFDRGCFHSFDEPGRRAHFAAVVHARLAEGALWLSLIGSKDGPDREKGPPRWMAAEIAGAVEPLFEILLLRATHFDSDQPLPLRGWCCLMRRREAPRQG